MNKSEAIARLQSHPKTQILLASRDATGHWFEHFACWIDDDGILVHSHPTDPRGNPCKAPESDDYRAYGG